MRSSAPPLLLVLLSVTASASAADWSFWRGPEQNGVSRERDLPDHIGERDKNVVVLRPKATPTNVVWRAPYGGITTPIVQGGRVYVINRVGEGPKLQERVMAFDAGSGKVLWQKRFNVFHTDIVEDRVGFTNLVGDPETGNVYAHATGGQFFCYDKDGKVLWKHSLTEEYGRVSGYGGRITSPIVDGDLVIIGIVNASWGEQTIGTTRLVAFDKRKGDVVWWGSDNYRVRDTHSCTPVVAVIGGQRLLISGGGDGGVHAFKVRTGEKVWSYIMCNGAVNCSPVVQGNRVYIGHGEENENGTQGQVYCFDGAAVSGGKPRVIWKVDGIKVKFASPLLHEDRLYVCDEVGKMYCLEANSGKLLWDFAYGRNTKGSPVWADGKIYITAVDKTFHILQPSDSECKELQKVVFRAPPGSVAPVELNGSPAVAKGRIYFMTTTELVCIGKKGWKPGAIATSVPLPAEAPVPKGAKPTHLQIVPADVTLTPGQSVSLKVRAFDGKGRPLGEVKGTWALAGMHPPVFPIGLPAPKPAKKPTPPPKLAGTLSSKTGPSTRLTVSKKRNGQFGRVEVRFGDLVGYARVRVAPVLPYAMDFEKVPVGAVPGGWVNTMGKFAVVQLKDGTRALRKRNDNPSPLVARANAYIGLPSMSDYLIEADVMGVKVRHDMPDAGVGANRYTLFLNGNDQTLRLVSWDAQRRIDRTIKFPWKSGVWYRMKLIVKVEGDKAVCRGKVWPRGQAEPEKWTIEVEDPSPNRHGSPLLYGFAAGAEDAKKPGAEIYYDNVSITANK
jgi:outer membrane protein assembly factor BamB